MFIAAIDHKPEKSFDEFDDSDFFTNFVKILFVARMLFNQWRYTFLKPCFLLEVLKKYEKFETKFSLSNSLNNMQNLYVSFTA